MPVFKLSIKIIKKNIPSMLIYVVIFLAISYLFSLQSSNQMQASFGEDKVNVVLISYDSSPLIDGFEEKLSEYANFVDLPDENEALQDALFFRTVDYILRIPEGFTDAIMKGDYSIQLEKIILPASTASAYIDITIDQYFNTARLYIDGISNISQEQLVSNLKEDLSYNVPVQFQDVELAEQDHSFAVNYFNYLAYSLFSVLILGISGVMIVLNDTDRKRRNSCSPVSLMRSNIEFLIAHMCFTIVSWAIMMVFYFIFDHKNGGYTHTIYFMLNSFAFALCASSISFLLGNLIKSQNVLSGVCNVVTLGPCFISGIFVPQELLGSTVLKVASFTPTYWYAKANGIIAKLSTFDRAHTQSVLNYMLIEIGFAIAFLSIALVINKKRRMSY